MLLWRHDYLAPQYNISSFWVDVNLAARLFSPPKWHLLALQVEGVDVILAGKDIVIVLWYKMRCTEFLHEQNSKTLNFGIRIPIWWLFNIGILKKNPTRISRIKNRIWILLPIGDPEIGTKNWNSQPRKLVARLVARSVVRLVAGVVHAYVDQKSNAVDLILRLFLYYFLHTMSSWHHEAIHNNTNNQQTPPPWWWSRSPLQRRGFNESMPSKWQAALRIYFSRLLLKGFGRINKLM